MCRTTANGLSSSGKSCAAISGFRIYTRQNGNRSRGGAMTNGTNAGGQVNIPIGPEEVGAALQQILDQLRELRAAVTTMPDRKAIIPGRGRTAIRATPMVDYCLPWRRGGIPTGGTNVQIGPADVARALKRIGDWIDDVRMVVGK